MRNLLPLVLLVAVACAQAGDDAATLGRDARLDPTRSYDDRVRILELIAEAHPYPDGWPDQRDGIRAQTEWQAASGRSTRAADGRIYGWWPNINWTLTVWQIQALQRRGELTWVQIEGFADPRFALPASIEAAVWEYYDEVDAARRRSEIGAVSPDERRAIEWRLQGLLWDYHSEAVRIALARNEDLIDDLPDGERQFATSWAYSLVEILAVIRFPTDEETVRGIQQSALPPRLVAPRDFDLTATSDLSALCRGGLIAIRALHRFERLTGGALRWFLARAVDNAERAAHAAHVFVDALSSAGDGIVDFIWDAITGSPHDHGGETAPPGSADACGGVTYEGYCNGGVVVWCDGGALASADCAAEGLGCGWVGDDVGYYCVSGCGDLDYYGACVGDSLRWCDAGQVVTFDCAAEGAQCAWQDDEIGYNCL